MTTGAQLSEYLDELSSRFDKAGIDIIGYSRGGLGVYNLLQSNAVLKSATVINSRLPISAKLPRIPIHIIHATNDQHTPLEAVKEFISQSNNDLILHTPWQGDHFSIASIARSGIWRRSELEI